MLKKEGDLRSLGRVEKKEGSLDRVEKWREVFEAWVGSSRNPTQRPAPFCSAAVISFCFTN